jgi:hypothetical protein
MLSGSLTSQDHVQQQRFGFDWSKIVSDYSHLNLTYATNVLPALSGIARSVEHLLPGKYIASLWERNIAYQLTWNLAYQDVPGNSYERPLHRPSPKRPTFSWISYSEPARFGFLSAKYTPLSTLISSDVRLATADPRGRILSASICLKGPCILGPEAVHIFKTTLHFAQPTISLDSGPRIWWPPGPKSKYDEKAVVEIEATPGWSSANPPWLDKTRMGLRIATETWH